MNISPYFEIFRTAAVKRSRFLDINDKVEYITEYSVYRSCMLNLEVPTLFKYTKDDFLNLGLSEDEAIYLHDNIPMIQSFLNSAPYADGILYDILMLRKKEEVINNYIEKNHYVRMLMGLPKYEDWLEIEAGNTSKKYTVQEATGYENINGVDCYKKIYNLSEYEIDVLQHKDIWNTILAYYQIEWVYFIGKNLTPFKIREMEEYGLLYIDRVNYPELSIIFEDNYNKNLRYFKCTLENQVYKEYLVNYEPSIMVYLLLATLSATVIDVANENFTIDFDDVDLITAILNSNGLPYIELPKMYLQPFIYNLEKMNREKGSKQVLMDLKTIFDINQIYRYLIYKKPVGNIFDKTLSNKEKYDLYFVKVPLEARDVEIYLEDISNHMKYIDLVNDDSTWGLSGDKLYDDIVEEEFNYYETKYISIENMFEFTQNAFDFTTLFKYVLNYKEFSDQFTFRHGRGYFFDMSVFEGFVYVLCLILKLKKWNDRIPETLDEVQWVMGINVNRDYEAWKKTINLYLSKPDYVKNVDRIIKVESVDDVYEFMYIFARNKDVLRVLQQEIIHCTEYDCYKVLKGLYDSITVVKAVKDVYQDQSGNQLTSYVEYIKEWNKDLYDVFIITDTDEELRLELSYILNLLEARLNEERDPVISGEYATVNALGSEYGVSTFEQLKTILKYYKYLTIDLKDYSLLFKVDNMLFANRSFVEMHEHQTEYWYKRNKEEFKLINHKNESLETEPNKCFVSVICIDDEGVENF